MNIDDAVKTVFSNYFNFSGRAQRSEFWWWTFFVGVVSFLLGFWEGLYEGIFDVRLNEIALGPFALVWTLATLIPHIAVQVRRLHDTDRSVWWLLIVVIPVIGIIVLIVFMCLRGTPGANRFGPDPILPTPSDTGLRNA